MALTGRRCRRFFVLIILTSPLVFVDYNASAQKPRKDISLRAKKSRDVAGEKVVGDNELNPTKPDDARNDQAQQQLEERLTKAVQEAVRDASRQEEQRKIENQRGAHNELLNQILLGVAGALALVVAVTSLWLCHLLYKLRADLVELRKDQVGFGFLLREVKSDARTALNILQAPDGKKREAHDRIQLPLASQSDPSKTVEDPDTRARLEATGLASSQLSVEPPRSYSGLATDAATLVRVFNADPEAFTIQYQFHRVALASGGNSSTAIFRDETAGRIWLIQRGSGRSWGVPFPKISISSTVYQEGGLKELFECLGYVEGRTYTSFELIAPAILSETSNGWVCEQKGKLQVLSEVSG